MKAATLVTLLVAGALAAPPMCAHDAIDFPIEYSGSWRLTVTVEQSLFSLPSGSASLPPITGQFDAEQVRAEYRIGNHTLIEWDLPAVSHLVAIEPDPSVGCEFHKSILEGKGFKFVFRDPHGRDHLDFGTLKILVGGVDTTQHVLSRLTKGIEPFTEENPDTRTKAFRLKPDPGKLMQGHDVFAIPFNGDWRIELRICDKGGTCFGKTYDKVYFGPFVSASPQFRVIDGRCLDSPDPFVRIQQVTVGNVGIDAPRTAIYLGLTSNTQGLWTYSLGDTGLGLRRSPFRGGEFTLVLAAVDTDTGAHRRDEHAVTMCNR